MRVGSPISASWEPGSISAPTEKPLAFACGRNVSTAPATSPDNENAVVSSSSLPASIFEKSSTSSMMRSSACAESRMVATVRRCASVIR